MEKVLCDWNRQRLMHLVFLFSYYHESSNNEHQWLGGRGTLMTRAWSEIAWVRVFNQTFKPKIILSCWIWIQIIYICDDSLSIELMTVASICIAVISFFKWNRSLEQLSLQSEKVGGPCSNPDVTLDVTDFTFPANHSILIICYASCFCQISTRTSSNQFIRDYRIRTPTSCFPIRSCE